jgi:hypothetical protein
VLLQTIPADISAEEKVSTKAVIQV